MNSEINKEVVVLQRIGSLFIYTKRLVDIVVYIRGVGHAGCNFELYSFRLSSISNMKSSMRNSKSRSIWYMNLGFLQMKVEL